MLIDIVKDLVFSPSNLSEITSDKKRKKNLLFIQYPYFLIGMFMASMVIICWTISQFIKMVFR